MNLCASSVSERAAFLKRPFSLLKFWAVLLCFISPLINFSQARDVDDLDRLSESVQTKYEIENVIVTGNTKTQKKIILRELTFRVGDKVTINELNAMQTRSQQNLINTSLFVFVTIGHDLIDEKISVHIDVKERWYIWPQPIFEIQDRNFNTWWKTKDMFRVNYGMYVTFENMFGLNQMLTLKFRQGYTENYGFSYRIPFLNKKQTIGMSAAYLFSRNNEIAYSTYGNQLKFFRSRDSYVRSEHEGKIGLTMRNGLYNKHVLELQFRESKVADTITALNPFYYSNEKNKIQYFSVLYNFKHDYRDNKIYPLKGYVAYFSFLKDGLGLLKHEDVDNSSLFMGISRYWNFLPRVYWANHLRARYSLARTPFYYFNRALGYGTDLVRGYEYYVVDGQSFALFKTNIRYQLVKPAVYHAKWAKRFDKFNKIPYAVYLGVYGDAAWVEDKAHQANNPLTNSLLIGAGVGLDFVTYYDYVLRVEFSVNQMQQKGVYLHLSAPF
jgi:outer membrane protein assembly factor BamA